MIDSNIRETLRNAFEARMEHVNHGHEEHVEPPDTLIPDSLKAIKRETYNTEYFIGGLLLGLHAHTLSWLILTAVFATPSYIVLRHSEWFQNDNKVDHVKIVAGCFITELCMLYCISNALN